MKKSIALLLAVMMMLMLLLVGCTTPSTGGDDEDPNGDDNKGDVVDPVEPDEPQVLKIGYAMDPETLDQNKFYTSTVTNILYGIYEPLVRTHESEVIPAAAESWEMSDDGLVWTFHLRDGLVWSDGEPLTAQHYVDGLERQSTPDFPTVYGYLVDFFVNGTAFNQGEITDFSEVGYKALDEKTLQMTLVNPVGYLLSYVSKSGFLPIRTDYTDAGEVYGTTPESSVYCGPYVFTEWKQNEAVTIKKNETYWDADNITLEEVQFVTIPQSDTRALLFEQGELDYAEIDPNQVPTYGTHEDFNQVSNGAITFMMFKLDHPVLSNKNMREAINVILDRDGLVASVYNGAAMPAMRYVPDTISGIGGKFTDQYPLDFISSSPDVDRAKALAAAGRAELGLSETENIDIYLMTGDTTSLRQLAEYTQDVLAELNITIDIGIIPGQTRWEDFRAGKYDITITGARADYDDPYGGLNGYDATGNFQHAQFKTQTAAYEAYTGYCAEAKVEPDNAVRMDLLAEAEKILVEESIVAPINFGSRNYLVANTVEGLTFDPVGHDINYIWATNAK